MNHLEDAKKLLNEFWEQEPSSMHTSQAEVGMLAIQANALIAIAEQLERANDLEEGMDYREYETKWKGEDK